MQLKTIKSKQTDEHYTKYVFKEIDLIKEQCQINDPIFFLGYFYFGQVFLSGNSIYVSNYHIEYKDHEPILETMVLTELYEIELLKDYPKTSDDLTIKTILSNDKQKFNADKFLFWIDEPCDINHEIDTPYYEVIKFLNKYTKDTFSTERYSFYSKRDEDLNFINNFYVYDKKNKLEFKLYSLDDFSEIGENAWVYTPPLSIKDVAIDDLGQNLSEYQKLKCKKEFLKVANEENEIFKVKNYWVMELVKLTIQPVLVLHEWSCHRCFCKPKLFGDIWVYDVPEVNEEPSFFITDAHFTKVAVLKFKSAEYLFKGIYKRGLAKAKGWKLNKQEIKELKYFLQSPSEENETETETGKYFQGYKKHVKTNWQHLIFEYNHNTAYWGWGDNGFDEPILEKVEGEIEQLPFDLQIPNYTKIR